VPRQNLLLVDGDTRSRRVLEVSLRKSGFSVTTAEDIDQALLVLEHGEPDLIISDTRLPGRDGFEFCTEVKNNPDWAGIPFVFLTSAKAIEDKVRGLELGVEDYLVKPIYIKEVTTRLRMLMQRKQREKLESKNAARTKFTGQLADMAVVDLFQTIEISRKSGTIQFETDLGDATIWFRDGTIIDAGMGRLQAEQAVYRLLGMAEGAFAVEFKPINRNPVIKESTQGLLMEGLRRVDEWGRLLEQLPALDSILSVDRSVVADLPEGLLSPDLEEVMLRFDGRRSIIEVVDDTGRDDLEALETISNLFFQGLVTNIRVDDDSVDDVQLGDSSTALKLEAWDVPTTSPALDFFQPATPSAESGPHAIPSEIPPMPSFPSSIPDVGEDGLGLVAGLPEETPSLGEGLTPLHDQGPTEDPFHVFDGGAAASISSTLPLDSPPDADRLGNSSASGPRPRRPSASDPDHSVDTLAERLSAIVDSNDEVDPLLHTAPLDPGPILRSREVSAAQTRIQREEAARKHVQAELERREAERSGVNAFPEADSDRGTESETEASTSTAPSSVERAVEVAERRARDRSMTESMFIAPRPAPVVVNDDDDDDDGDGDDGDDGDGDNKETSPSPDTEIPAQISSASSSGLSRPEPKPPKVEARRLASPAPRTESSWTKPPSLSDLGLDFGKPKPELDDGPAAPTTKPGVGSTADPTAPDTPADADDQDVAQSTAAQSSRGHMVDSGAISETHGEITPKKDDEFAPVEVKIAEPAQETIASPRSSVTVHSRTSDREPSAANEHIAPIPSIEDEADPAKTGLWITVGILASVALALFLFRDSIFTDPGGSGVDPSDSSAGGDAAADTTADAGVTPPTDLRRDDLDVGARPDPAGSGMGSDSEPAESTDDADTGTDSGSDSGSGSDEPGAGTAEDELTPEQLTAIEIKLKSAERFFKNYQRADQAAALIDEILEIAPTHAATLLLRAEVLAEQGELEDALAAAKRATMTDPDLARAFSALGGLYEATGDKPAALKAYKHFLELEPHGHYSGAIRGQIRRLEREMAKESAN